MPPKRLSLTTTHAHKGMRLDQVLALWLPEALSQPISKAKVRKLIVAGAVYLNGKRVRIASKELQANARVDAYVDLHKLKDDGRARDRQFRLAPADILFEDEYLIAVNKPPGLPTQPTLDEARDNLFALLKKFLAERDRVAQPYVGLHHRLDRDTSGVVLFTKKVEANAGVSEMFKVHTAVKTYQALTSRPRQLPPAEWSVKNYLGKSREPGLGKKKNKMASVRSGGDFAHTDFRLLEANAGGLWLEAKPRTGRTHQIRVHLSEAGMPILGDETYGGKTGVAPRLMLHAANLTFPHPISKVEISIHSPVPEDFNQCQKRLSALSERS